MLLHSHPVLVAYLQAGIPPFVVELALLGIAQSLLGLLQLLEYYLRFLIAVVLVGMIFHRQNLITRQEFLSFEVPFGKLKKFAYFVLGIDLFNLWKSLRGTRGRAGDE